MKELKDRAHERDQTLAKHLRCNVLAFGRCHFPKSIPFLMFERILNTPLVPIKNQVSIKEERM